jgi:hypothetical protein
MTEPAFGYSARWDTDYSRMPAKGQGIRILWTPDDEWGYPFHL